MSAPARVPRPLGRFKRRVFSAGLVAVLYLFTEIVVFVIGTIYNHDLSWDRPRL